MVVIHVGGLINFNAAYRTDIALHLKEGLYRSRL
ncbi:Uncharacterised protein [Mycobacteroides abscessus subsp. abscessus]|nr:Uncharacterised protein [Mycobacteroides abscessus subsp. abscessus]